MVCDSFAASGPQMRGPAHCGQHEDLKQSAGKPSNKIYIAYLPHSVTHIHPHWNFTHFQNTGKAYKTHPTVGSNPFWFYKGKLTTTEQSPRKGSKKRETADTHSALSEQGIINAPIQKQKARQVREFNKKKGGLHIWQWLQWTLYL